ncbi:MAG TPA: terminase family protein, partial [Pseudomonadales bacterium]|nr:terminase family protein [Pseudomonadales bacterium]
MADETKAPTKKVATKVVAPKKVIAANKVASTKKKAPTNPTETKAKPRPKKGVRIIYEHTSPLKQDDLISLPIYAPLSIKQERYLQDQENDIVVWGGAASAGKTQLSLIRILLCAMYDKHYVAAIARRSQKQMKSAGSLWSTGVKMFSPYGVASNNMELAWRFPNGSEVKCHHLDDNQDDWQGTQCTEFLVDEAQQCNEEDIWYLTSRLRSRSSQKHQLRM